MNGRILVVDDERNIRLTFRRVIENMELETDEAANGEEALRKVEDGSYALMLLDLRMPGMDGMELLRKIRGNGNEMKVVIITAHGTVENAVEAMKLGAVDFLRKPCSSEDVRRIVSDALARRGDFFKPAGPMYPLSEAVSEGAPAEWGGAEGDYEYRIQQAKAAIELRKFDEARRWTENALALEAMSAEAFNLLGVLHELRHNVSLARRCYRAALSLEPSYAPATHNLNRTTGIEDGSLFDIGENPGAVRQSRLGPPWGVKKPEPPVKAPGSGSRTRMKSGTADGEKKTLSIRRAVIPRDSPLTGKRLRDVAALENTFVLAIIRDGMEIDPDESTVLDGGDGVVFFAEPSECRGIIEALSGTGSRTE